METTIPHSYKIHYELDHATYALQMCRIESHIYSPPFYFPAAPLLAFRISLWVGKEVEDEQYGETTYFSAGLCCDSVCSSNKENNGNANEWSCSLVEGSMTVGVIGKGTANLRGEFAGSLSRAKPRFEEIIAKMRLEELLDPKKGYLTVDAHWDSLVISTEFTISEAKTGQSPQTDGTHIPAPFNSQHRSNDVTFVVEGQRLYANRGYLAQCSPFFEGMFYSDMAESSKKEIPLVDVAYGEFAELLLVAYPGRKPIGKDNIEFVLKLADRFLFIHVLEQCKEFFADNNVSADWPLAKCFRIAEAYPALLAFKTKCLSYISTRTDVQALCKEHSYKDLSQQLKLEIFAQVSLKLGHQTKAQLFGSFKSRLSDSAKVELFNSAAMDKDERANLFNEAEWSEETRCEMLDWLGAPASISYRAPNNTNFTYNSTSTSTSTSDSSDDGRPKNVSFRRIASHLNRR